MTDKTSGLAAVAAAADAISKTDHDASLATVRTQAEADKTSAVATATAAGVKDGATAERTRIKAILGSEQAKGRDGLAQHFAFNTDMTPEQAQAALDQSPKAEASKGRLDGAVPQPKVDAVDSKAAADAPVLALRGNLTQQLAKIGKAPLAN